MRWLRNMVAGVGKWLARQALATVVVLAGVCAGWMGRKWTGPALVSESLPRPEKISAQPVGQPAPLREADPVAAALRGEIASLENTGHSLERLQAALASGSISHFKGLALDLLSHPLPHFRTEALKAVVAAWRAADPSGFLDFIEEIGENELMRAAGKEAGEWAGRAINAWAAKDPQGLLAKYDGMGRAGEVVPLILEKGGLEEKLPWMLERLGEEALGKALDRYSTSWEFADGFASGRKEHMSAEEWRRLAVEAKDPTWAMVCARQALLARKYGPGGGPLHINEMKEWLGPLADAPGVRDTLAMQAAGADVAAHLPELLSKDREDEMIWRHLTSRLKPGQLVEGLEGLGGDVPPNAFRYAAVKLREEDPSVIVEAFRAAKSPAQQQAFSEGLKGGHWDAAGKGYARMMQVTDALGSEGDSLRLYLMSNVKGQAAQRVSEDFARQTPSFQAAHRLDIATSLAGQSPEAAAAVWAGAGPGELTQPGASVVAEEIASRFLDRDSVAASAWIAQLPPGESRDRAVARMIEESAADDPQTCAQWLAEIHDPTARERAATALAWVQAPAAQGGFAQ